MSARNSLNPDQLKLFMTGTEIQQTVSSSWDKSDNESMGELWDWKLEEAKLEGDPHSFKGGHGSGIYHSLLKHGYDAVTAEKKDLPGYYSHPSMEVKRSGEKWLSEGHHRVAAAADIERQTGRQIWMPVNYEGDYDADSDWGS